MLIIDRWHHAVRLVGAHREPQAATARVEAVSRACGEALGQALAGALQQRSGERIHVRRLVLPVTLDLRSDPAHAARALAAQLALAIVRCIDDGGAEVVRFDSELDEVEAFALALAAGDAHQRWYFAAYAGLAALPPGAALRTWIENRPALAWPLLARLARQPSVLALFEEGDALRVIDALAAVAGDTGEPDPAQPPAPAVPFAAAAAPAAGAVALLARAAARGAALSRALLVACIGQALSESSPTSGASTFERTGSIRASRFAELRARWQALGGADDPPHARPHPPAAPAEDDPAVPPPMLPCAMAGLVMLLAELDGLLDDRFSATLPTLQSGSARGAFALLVLATAAGNGAPAVWDDVAWRGLLDVPPALTLPAYGQALLDAGTIRQARSAWPAAAWRLHRGDWRTRAADARALAPRAWSRALPGPWRTLANASAALLWRRVARRVPGMLDASLPYLRRNLLAGDGHAERIDDDHWCWRCPRAPLHVLLAMTSLSGREQGWSGPPRRAIRIRFV